MHYSITKLLNRRIVAIVAAAGVLVACGADQVAGIQGTGNPVASGVTSVGPISGFGSVIQGGVEYATSGAQIRLDDQSGTESQLRVGQVVVIKGSVNPDGVTGTATEVTFISDLRGPVGQIDVAAGTFKVLGQTVRVDDATVFDDGIQPASLEGLQSGTAVQVSGFANAAREIVASRVDLSVTGLQVRGVVASLDAAAHTFVINSLTVNYGSVTPTGTLANGSTVVVRGVAIANGALVATQVQVIGALSAAANDRGNLDGLIAAFVSNADFTVEGQRVITDGSTVFDLGGAVLGVDVPVRVRGTFTASGALLASRVEVKAKNLSLVRGQVDAVSSANKTLTVLGVAITTNVGTSFEDKSNQHVKLFRLADVRTGDYVEVRGVPGTGNSLVATLVQRDKPEDRVYLQGLARDLANPNFTILGLQVMTNAQTRFVGLGGQSRAAEQFFSDASGRAVRVRGALAGGVVVADQVKIQH